MNKRLPAKLTISRTRAVGKPDEVMTITVLDEISRCEIVTVEVSLERMMRALTAYANQPCIAEWNTDELGKRREVKQVDVPFDGSVEGYSAVAAERALKPYEVDGWTGRPTDLVNHHNYRKGPKGQRLQEVTFVRFVEATDEDVKAAEEKNNG